MFASIRQKLNELQTDNSGNATLLLALGLPVLMGGTGLAVDTAQWYLWKNELQFAVDQAALAGAWARTSSNTSVQDTYKTRAAQEYNANVEIVADFDSATQVTLANYGSGTNNSVKVNATASAPLPFSTFLTGKTTLVGATAQASFTSGTTYVACMLAVHPTANQAFKFGGSVSGSSTCGAGSLSNDADAAMKEIGNTSVPLGKLVATGGIDPGFANNGTIYENQGGLSDPYASLEPPSSSSSSNYTYSCPTAQAPSTTWTITYYTRTFNTYKYYKGANMNNATLTTYTSGTGYIANGNTDSASATKTQTTSATTGWKTATADVTEDAVYTGQGSGSNRIWRVRTYHTQDNYTNVTGPVVVEGNDGIARPLPGKYTNISITCETQFQAGVYFISGSIDFGQNLRVTAPGTLFVMTGSAGTIHINSNSILDVKGITAAKLTDSYGVSSSDAAKMAGMLFFDKDSTSAFGMNGNANVKIDGTLYMPNRDATFNGTVDAATGGCMMVASRTLVINGNFNITNFCTPSGASTMSIGGGTATVKLVA